jgi:hypothetical protein
VVSDVAIVFLWGFQEAWSRVKRLGNVSRGMVACQEAWSRRPVEMNAIARGIDLVRGMIEVRVAPSYLFRGDRTAEHPLAA